MKKFCLFICVFMGLFSWIKAEEKNAIIVCENGLEMFSWDLEFIRKAKHSIEVAPCLCGGSILQDLLTEIEARLELYPDLQVYILASPVLIEKDDYPLIDHLEKSYPDNLHLLYTSSVAVIWPDITCIDSHMKMLIVDEQYFSAGGTNLDVGLCNEGTYTVPHHYKGEMFKTFPAGVRDQDVVGRGPLAKELRQTFHKHFALWEQYNDTMHLEKNPEKFSENNYYTPIDAADKPFVESFETAGQLIFLEEGKIELILGGPHQKSNAITKKYKKLIENAKNEIVVGNLYFFPPNSVFKALMDATNRDVKLTVVTNGVKECPEYTKMFCWANRINYVPAFYGRTFHFWEAAACAKRSVKQTRVFEYDVSDMLYHKKVMIIDRRYFVIGSFNLGTRSDTSDYELTLVIDSPEAAEEALKIIDRDIEYSEEVSPKEARGWYFDPITAYYGELQKRYHGLL